MKRAREEDDEKEGSVEPPQKITAKEEEEHDIIVSDSLCPPYLPGELWGVVADWTDALDRLNDYEMPSGMPTLLLGRTCRAIFAAFKPRRLLRGRIHTPWPWLIKNRPVQVFSVISSEGMLTRGLRAAISLPYGYELATYYGRVDMWRLMEYYDSTTVREEVVSATPLWRSAIKRGHKHLLVYLLNESKLHFSVGAGYEIFRTSANVALLKELAMECNFARNGQARNLWFTCPREDIELRQWVRRLPAVEEYLAASLDPLTSSAWHERQRVAAQGWLGPGVIARIIKPAVGSRHPPF